MGYPSRASDEDVRRAVRDEVARQLAPLASELRTSMERLQVMLGERGAADGSQKAVRRGDIAGLGSASLTAVELAGAPTAADYNKVVADLAALNTVLVRLRDTFK